MRVALGPSSAIAPGRFIELYDGRDVLVFVPPKLPAGGARALVIVLHGGGGNATSIEGAGAEAGLRIDPARVFGMGHSNGAMMMMRLMCDTTIFAAAVSVSGPLNVPVRSCPGARGRQILSIHGAVVYCLVSFVRKIA